METHSLRGLQGPVAALLTTGSEGGSLPMAAVALPTGTGSARQPGPVPFLVEIEGAGLLAAGPADVRRIEIYAYAVGPSGGVHGFLAQSLRLDLKAWGEALLAGGIKFAGTVDLPPGEGSVRILVLDPDTLRYSLRVLPVTQPATGDSRPVLLPPSSRSRATSGSWRGRAAFLSIQPSSRSSLLSPARSGACLRPFPCWPAAGRSAPCSWGAACRERASRCASATRRVARP